MAEQKETLSLKETLLCDQFVNQILIGSCPKCGSNNVHDCKAQSPIMVKGFLSGIYRQYGSNCPVAMKLDDSRVAHCDDCNYLWCLECGAELSFEDPDCDHW